MPIQGSNVAATQEQIVATLVQETLKQKSILLPTVMDYSSWASVGATSVKVPRRDQFSAANKTEGSDLTTQQITFANDEILLNLHKAIYVEIEMRAEQQSKVSTMAQVIQEQAAELALQLDRDLIAQLKLASAAAPDHIIANTANIQDDILEARRLKNAQVVPMDNRFLVVSVDKEKEMLQVADFVRADSYGSPEGLRNGELGRIYGYTVLMHTELAADEFLAYHKSHVGYATQITPDFQTDKNLKGVKDEFLLHTLYGTKVLDTGKRGVLFNTAGA